MERSTRQRTAIHDTLAAAGRPLLPQEILASAHAQVPGLGIATVYRNLKALVEEGVLQPVELPGQSTRYELAHRAHHHHFQCKACQRVFDIHACPGDLSSLAPAGFVVDEHEINLYGLCGDCAVTAGRGAGAAGRGGGMAGRGIGAEGRGAGAGTTGKGVASKAPGARAGATRGVADRADRAISAGATSGRPRGKASRRRSVSEA